MEMNPPIDDNFRIKIELDTQILAYLVDKTYPNLYLFIEELSKSPFVDIVCSRFAIYEFVGIRKVEHYLRCLVDEATKNGTTPNFSSALKYKNEFDIPEMPYSKVFSKIKKAVENELKEISDLLNLSYDTLTFPDKLWKPHQDLVLSTRISKEDSLLLMSSIFIEELRKEDYFVLLTNDSQFHTSLKEKETDEILKKYKLTKPKVHFLRNIVLKDKTKFDLVSDKERNFDIKDFTTKFILERIKEKNQKLYIGKVKTCPEKHKGELLCFGLEANTLENNLYLSVLSEKLEYLYNIKEPLTDFHYGREGKRIENTYTPIKENKDSRNISVQVKVNGDYLNEEDYSKISKTGDLVFIHPDTFN